MTGNITVTKSNILVEASYKLTLEEQRLILACIGQLDGRKSVPDDIVITAIDYADIFDLSQKISYHQLTTAAKRLYVRDVRTYISHPPNRDLLIYLHAQLMH